MQVIVIQLMFNGVIDPYLVEWDSYLWSLTL